MKQLVIVVVVMFFLVAIVIVAAYYGGGSFGPSNIDKGQRLKAPPGKTRKNAIALTSNKRPTTEDPKPVDPREIDGAEDDTPLTIKSLSAPGEKREGPAHERATEALNSADPETGLKKLDAALALPHDRQQVAYLHEAMGQLYAQLDPPDYEKATAAFEEARAAAKDPVLEESILLKSVQILMQGGMDERALAALDSGFDGSEILSQTQFRLQLLRGQLAERTGNVAEAERVYLDVLDRAMAIPESLERDSSLMLIRLASLRLTKLYRAQNRGGAADLLSKDVKKQLDSLSNET
jgi:tetratricopeptide (TPR) repeat protein